MPFVNRFASPFAPPPGPFGMLRNHPVMLATGAATAGVLLGAYVAVQLFAAPEKIGAGPPSPKAAAVAIEPAPPIAEVPNTAPNAPPTAVSTGSAPSVEPVQNDTAAVSCDKQTWPNLSHDCLKNGGARAAAPPPAITKPDPKPTQPVTTANNRSAAPQLQSPVAAAKPAAQAASTAQSETEQPAAKPESKPQKHVARKTKRKPAKRDYDGEGDNSFASSNYDDRGFDRRYDRYDRFRGAQRWNDRRYDRRNADADDDDAPRRAIIVRRGNGLFEGLFGNFGDSD